MQNRLTQLNMIVLTIVVFYTIFTHQLLATSHLSPKWAASLLLISTIGAYRLLITIVYWTVKRSEWLLQLYWGKQYVAGIWTYFYTIQGAAYDESAGTHRYFGVWKFEQDLFGTSVTGFGLTNAFTIRSKVNSVTDMIKRGNCYEIVNSRTDTADPAKGVFSVTNMMLCDFKQCGLGKQPTSIKAETVIYGGVLSGAVHNDELTRHPGFEREEQAIDYLKQLLIAEYQTPETVIA